MKIKDFQNSREVMEAILRKESIGYLGLAVGDTPYVVPLNYAYFDGKILFHCALAGRKLDYLKRNKSVCFTVARQSGPIAGHEGEKTCHTDTESVMCFGNARIIEDMPERHATLNIFNKYFRPNADEIAIERTRKCNVVEIKIDEMTGRQETNPEGQKRTYTYWRYRFDE